MRAYGVLAVAGIISSTSVARGDAKSDAKALFTEGRALYDAGQFDKAALKFKAAHAKDPDPVYLFNAGQALRFAKHCDEAVAFYERFLRDMPDAPNRDAVDGYLGEARTCAKEQQPPPPPPKKVVIGSGGSRALAYLATGVGLAAVGTGVFLTTRMRSKEREHNRIVDGCNAMASATTECDLEDVQRAGDLKAAGRSLQNLSIVAYSAGGVAVAVGIYLWMRKPASARETQVTVVPTRDGVMAASAWRF